MSISIAESIFDAAQVLHEAAVSEARREASSLLQYVIGRDRTFIISHADHLITREQSETFRRIVARRAKGEPLQYITGCQPFFGLDFEVTKDVLIPRPETEQLVETALILLRDVDTGFLICDLGTGSGCIAVTLLHERPAAHAVGIDISAEALRVASRNALRHGVAQRINLVACDAFSALNASEAFDLIVSNPPYVAGPAIEGLQREVRNHEPRVALSPGADGLLIIRRLLSESGAFLKKSGYLLFEIGFDQGSEVERLIDRNIWRLLDIRHDLQGIPRIVALQKTAS